MLNNFNYFLSETIKDKLKAEREKVNTKPSDAQIKAENYAMGHIFINGFDITIENPKGSYRCGKDRNGKEWKTYMHNDYGYFRGTVGKDRDAIDVFIGNNYGSDKIFAIDQKINGIFDETKVMFCFNTIEQAKEAYLSNYEKDWKGFWKITEVDINTFKKWLYDGQAQNKPFFDYVEIKKAKLNESLDEINAYHGSSSDFDKFNHKKYLSTGAGSQAFGWGTYVTDDVKVGTNYAKLNTKDEVEALISNGKEVTAEDVVNYVSQFVEDKKRAKSVGRQIYYKIANDLSRNKSINDIISDCESSYKFYSGKKWHDSLDIEFYLNVYKCALGFIHEHGNDMKIQMTKKNYNGYLYSVEIPDDNGVNYLRWYEKPTDEQLHKIIYQFFGLKDSWLNKLKEVSNNGSTIVKYVMFAKKMSKGISNTAIFDYYKKMADFIISKIGNRDNVSWIYSTLTQVFGNSQKAASLFLLQCGFDGFTYPTYTKYKRPEDNQTQGHNYVIFDANKVKIIKKENI